MMICKLVQENDKHEKYIYIFIFPHKTRNIIKIRQQSKIVRLQNTLYYNNGNNCLYSTWPHCHQPLSSVQVTPPPLTHATHCGVVVFIHLKAIKYSIKLVCYNNLYRYFANNNVSVATIDSASRRTMVGVELMSHMIKCLNKPSLSFFSFALRLNDSGRAEGVLTYSKPNNNNRHE